MIGNYLVASGQTYMTPGGIWASTDGKVFTQIEAGVAVGGSGIVTSNGVGYFAAVNSSNQTVGLYDTDGTALGTGQIGSGLDPVALATVAGRGVVVVDHNADGTASVMLATGPSGTALSTIADASLNAFASDRGISTARSAGGRAFFTGIDSGGYYGVWATDGTVSGTVEIYRQGPSDAMVRTPSLIGSVGDRMLIDTGYGIMASDGTAQGTVSLFFGSPSGAAFTGDKAFFLNEYDQPAAIVVTDGTTGGTRTLAIAGLATPLGDLTAIGNQIVFVGTDTSGRTAFFITDGTDAGSNELSLPAGVTLDPNTLPAIAPLPDTPTPPGGQTVTLGAGDQTYSASAGDTVLAGSGHDTITALQGSVLVVASRGSLAFIGGSGPSTVAGGQGAETIFGGTGGGNFGGGAAGGNVLVSQGASGANTTLTDGGAGDQLFGANAGNHVLIAAAGRETVLAGSGHTTIDGGATAGCVIFTGAGTTDYFGGAAGGDTVVAGSGATTATAQHGDAIFGGAGSLAVTGSTAGADSIVGGSGSLSVDGQGANMLVVAGSGTNTIATGNGAALIFAGSGSSTITGGQGSLQIMVGRGSGVINEGAGTCVYDVIKGEAGGTSVIDGFKTTHDEIRLFGYQPSGLTTTLSAGNTLLSLSDGTRIELLGVTNPVHAIVA